jgi:hypothetical protein
MLKQMQIVCRGENAGCLLMVFLNLVQHKLKQGCFFCACILP